MSLRVSPEVEAELDNIWLHIATESGSLDAADRLIDSITSQFVFLSKHPHLGRRRNDLRSGLRSLAVGSYVVIYRVEAEDVLILHVLHGRRDIGAIVRHQ